MSFAGEFEMKKYKTLSINTSFLASLGMTVFFWGGYRLLASLEVSMVNCMNET